MDNVRVKFLSQSCQPVEHFKDPFKGNLDKLWPSVRLSFTEIPLPFPASPLLHLFFLSRSLDVPNLLSTSFSGQSNIILLSFTVCPRCVVALILFRIVNCFSGK